MAKFPIKLTVDAVNLEPVLDLVKAIESVIELKEKGASYKHAYRTLMTEYEVFKAHIQAECDNGEVKNPALAVKTNEIKTSRGYSG